MSSHPPDLEAEISFLPTEQGGRSAPAPSGYRAAHDFGVGGMLNDAMHEYVGCQSIAPGSSAKANLWFLAPEYQSRRLHPSFRFPVQEGSRIVGHGVILSVINPELRDGT